MALFKKRSTLDARLKRIERELSRVNSDLKTLSRRKKRSVRRDSAETAAPDGAPRLRSESARRTGGDDAPPQPQPGEDFTTFERKQRQRDAQERVHDDRFRAYLNERGFDNTGPLRYERRIQRNRAIVMALVTLLLLLWVLIHFFL